jgi:plasmid stability protein
MGDMTIGGLDEATLTNLRSRAEEHGVTPESYAATLLRQALAPPGDRLAVSRAMRAAQRGTSPISSVELVRQIRDEAQ